MTRVEQQVRAAVALQASEWFLANRSGALSRAESTQFMEWLRASPIHVEEYLGVALVSRDLPAAVAKLGEPLDALLEQARVDAASNVSTLVPRSTVDDQPDHPFNLRRWAFSAAPLAAAAALVIVALSVTTYQRDGHRFGLPQTYESAHGQQITQTLPDGTTLQLNTESSVTVKYSAAERLVELSRGQALFQVVHDARRPFRVAVDDANIVDVGTRFDVYRNGNNTVLTVVDGQVAVSRIATAGADAARGVPVARLVSAGQRLVLVHGVATGSVEVVDLAQAEAWLSRRILFRARPLGEAVAEVNRYSRKTLQIADPALGTVPVSGVFDAYDTDSFITFLRTVDGLAVQEVPQEDRVILRSAQPPVPPAAR